LSRKRNSKATACRPVATCDGFFYRNQKVSGYRRGQTPPWKSLLYLSNIAAEVTCGKPPRQACVAEKILHRDKLFEKPPIGKWRIHLGSHLDEVLGDGTGVTVCAFRPA